jgi:NADH-quinone oxidoreductase subunit A
MLSIDSSLNSFVSILLFLIGGIGFLLVSFTIAKLLRPNRENDEKLTSYECGEEVVGTGQLNINARFYIIALMFVLFEIEIIFLFPMSTVFANVALQNYFQQSWVLFVAIEITVFVLLLLLGLAFAWKKGYLEWTLPEVKTTHITSEVPDVLYEAINKKYQK